MKIMYNLTLILTQKLFVVRSLVASTYPINLSRLYLYKPLQVNHSITK